MAMIPNQKLQKGYETKMNHLISDHTSKEDKDRLAGAICCGGPAAAADGPTASDQPVHS